jgi:hypothetical protein
VSGGETLPERRSLTEEIVDAIPGLVRLGVGIWMRTAVWTAESSMRVGARLVRAAMSGESAAQLLQETGRELREQARRLLALDGLEPDEEIPADAEVIESVAVEPGTPSCCAARPTSTTTSPPIPPSPASSTSWRRTRRASCATCTSKVRSPRSTCARARCPC